MITLINELVSNTEAKFPLGRLVATSNFMHQTGESGNAEIIKAISRHQSGDWGSSLCQVDSKMNDDALQDPQERLMSVYHTQAGLRFYVITEWDRSVTTVLLPEDY